MTFHMEEFAETFWDSQLSKLKLYQYIYIKCFCIYKSLLWKINVAKLVLKQFSSADMLVIMDSVMYMFIFLLF